MDALTAHSGHLAAIAYAQREAIQLDDSDLHCRLVRLRIDGAPDHVARATPSPNWPPAFADPFPDDEAIPEIGREALNTAIMGGAILHHGSLIVRGLVDRDEAERLARGVDRAFEAHDAWADDPGNVDCWMSPVVTDPEFTADRQWGRFTGGVYAPECPALFNRLADLYERSGIIAAITGYLGERPVVSVKKSVLRRVEPSRAGDFHQDGAFLGDGVRTINVWIALTDCGVDSPGLEIVDRRLDGIVPTGTDDATMAWTVGRGEASKANLGRPLARPEFKAGDAILFDHLMLHATSYDVAMTRPRWALESWFFAPSTFADGRIPVLL